MRAHVQFCLGVLLCDITCGGRKRTQEEEEGQGEEDKEKRPSTSWRPHVILCVELWFEFWFVTSPVEAQRSL